MGLSYEPDALANIPSQDANHLIRKIDWLWTNRQSVTHFPLSDNLTGFYKRRLGKYRIIYTYDANPDDMVIRLVGLRDNIYKRLP